MQASRARARLPQTVLIVIGLFLAKFPAPPQSPPHGTIRFTAAPLLRTRKKVYISYATSINFWPLEGKETKKKNATKLNKRSLDDRAAGGEKMRKKTKQNSIIKVYTFAPWS